MYVPASHLVIVVTGVVEREDRGLLRGLIESVRSRDFVDVRAGM